MIEVSTIVMLNVENLLLFSCIVVNTIKSRCVISCTCYIQCMYVRDSVGCAIRYTASIAVPLKNKQDCHVSLKAVVVIGKYSSEIEAHENLTIRKDKSLETLYNT